jgi:hypothetical protein
MLYARGLPLIPAIVALSACATAPATEMRVLVQTAAPLGDAALVADAAANGSGRKVSYIAPAGSGWHTLALSCHAPSDCDDALRRLQADRRFAVVQRDERKRIVTP